ncbi:MAG: carbohydrate kinase family protein [Anaerolineae bacterium]|jgi:sugar/nucleoside kinase (ribokinase family)|nr:carbohydrate kinase family protein [Anaerolineae bacterium]MDH7473101.1 carbohydrate kinase family protein [Anaerolineae bacterium]
MIEAVVAGHLCLDIIPQFVADLGSNLAAYLAPGRLTEVGPATFSTGGAVSNAGINLYRLGIRTQLMGKIGDDLLGRAIMDIVSSHSPELAQGMVVVPGETSSYTLVINPPGVDRLFLHYPGTNHTFRADDIRYDLLAEARLFHFGYPPLMARMYTDEGCELAEMYRRAKETGVTTSLDLAIPDPAGPSGQADWQTILARTLPYVDLFVPSAEELLFMLWRDRFDQLTNQVGAANLLGALAVEEIVSLADAALAMGANLVLLKLGTRGLYLRTAKTLPGLGRGAPSNLRAWANRQLWAPCFRPDAVVSTVGTGDAAIAGFLAAVLRDTSPPLALNVAVAVGACCVEVAGALGGVRTWEETLARIRAGWARLPLDLEPFGWVWDDNAALWRGPADQREA